MNISMKSKLSISNIQQVQLKQGKLSSLEEREKSRKIKI
jgi:hypothetical protein